MSNIKTTITNGWQKVKDWSKEHKEEIALGAIVAVVGAIGIAVHSVVKKLDAHEDEGQDILRALEMAKRLDGGDDDESKDIDRYVIDTAVMNTLPAGTYNVFDSYENERVDYVVEEKESMET